MLIKRNLFRRNAIILGIKLQNNKSNLFQKGFIKSFLKIGLMSLPLMRQRQLFVETQEQTQKIGKIIQNTRALVNGVRLLVDFGKLWKIIINLSQQIFYNSVLVLQEFLLVVLGHQKVIEVKKLNFVFKKYLILLSKVQWEICLEPILASIGQTCLDILLITI